MPGLLLEGKKGCPAANLHPPRAPGKKDKVVSELRACNVYTETGAGDVENRHSPHIPVQPSVLILRLSLTVVCGWAPHVWKSPALTCVIFFLPGE